ncbi:unnamed protein product [Lampetra fluviatilis]
MLEICPHRGCCQGDGGDLGQGHNSVPSHSSAAAHSAQNEISPGGTNAAAGAVARSLAHRAIDTAATPGSIPGSGERQCSGSSGGGKRRVGGVGCQQFVGSDRAWLKHGQSLEPIHRIGMATVKSSRESQSWNPAATPSLFVKHSGGFRRDGGLVQHRGSCHWGCPSAKPRTQRCRPPVAPRRLLVSSSSSSGSSSSASLRADGPGDSNESAESKMFSCHDLIQEVGVYRCSSLNIAAIPRGVRKKFTLHHAARASGFSPLEAAICAAEFQWRDKDGRAREMWPRCPEGTTVTASSAFANSDSDSAVRDASGDLSRATESPPRCALRGRHLGPDQQVSGSTGQQVNRNAALGSDYREKPLGPRPEPRARAPSGLNSGQDEEVEGCCR